jgi:hypothetical protein
MFHFAAAVHPRVGTFLAGILVLAVAPGEGQVPVPLPLDRSAWVADVERRLAADDPRDVAWGAWLAGRLELAELGPELVAVLVAEHPPNASPYSLWEYVRGQALDALVRIDATVPPAAIPRAWDVDRAAALLLAASDPARHGDFLFGRLDTRLDDTEWIVVHELLIAARPRELTASLLARIHIGIEVVVRDTDLRSSSRQCGGRNTRSLIFGSASVPTDYPPGTAYRLSFRAAPGGVVLTRGKRPVYYERRAFAPGESGRWGGARVSTARDRETLAYLHKLARLDDGEEDPLRTWSTWCVRFEDDEMFLEAIAEVRAAHRRRVTRVLHRLMERELVDAELTPDDVLGLDLLVRDERASPRAPLPSVGD